MRLGFLIGVVGALAFATGSWAQDKAPSFKFTRLAEKLPAGSQWAELQAGAFCATKETRTADGSMKPADLSLYAPVFEREFGHAASTKTTSTNLFDKPDDVSGADYEIGGLVHGERIRLCYQTISPQQLLIPLPVPSKAGYKGTASLQIQWQIYSTAKRQVVATIETQGSYELTERRQGDATQTLLQQAFAANVRHLASAPEIEDLLKAPVARAAATATREGGFAKLSMPSGHLGDRTPAEAVGAVVLVSTADGHGSGVLVSSDGYLLTNQHVVGEFKTVRIRWSDGLETDGQVLRTHKGRDVALIKTDPRGREPLAVREAPVQPGDTLLAIGAPLDEKLQGTVTRGVMSANRVQDGYAFIQSDVMVNHGNSGGALIDDHGRLVGLTDIGLQENGAPLGLNFFIPIRDALDFLSVDLAPAPEPAKPPVQKVSGPARSAKR